MSRQRLMVWTLIVALVGAVTAPAACAQAADWRQVKIPPLPAFHPQQPKRIVLANGMVIFPAGGSRTSAD